MNDRSSLASDLMRQHDIDRIVFVPSSDLIPNDSFHAWPFGACLAEYCGVGETVEEAIHDAARRAGRMAA